ncbi:hypothetical protein DID88_003057 [Monilinia fructigena]|uniref:Uncharacterized protein n=1 Tax=Monilinia fructigena TaxID=38457 RepID=A0A395IF03_9HELO|nr:hypothetical protein DID88_003057 [Monilinia fructigena]
MDSEHFNQTYSPFTYLQNRVPSLPPIPDTTQVRQQETNRLKIQSEMNPSSSRGDWTVHGPHIVRGNLGTDVDLNDPRMSIGWKESPTAARVQDFNTQRWASPAQDQPFMWDTDYGPRANQVDANTQTSAYPHPDLSLPHPSLNLDFPRLETNYLLQTHDEPPAHISIKTHGWRTGPPEVLAQLADPATADQVDPNSYKFRLFIEMETGDERYSGKVNCGMWVGSGMRKGAEVVYDAYRIS